MRIIVLGAAAGGGFPQWNCNSEYCRLARSGSDRTVARTQSSLAVTADDQKFVLLNCSPDVRQQINQTSALHPGDGLRSSPIKAVVLTNGDIDHIAGLLSLRENTPFRLYAAPRVQMILRDNPIFNVLHPQRVKRETVLPSSAFIPTDAQGESMQLEIEAFAVAGKVPLFMEDRGGEVKGDAYEGDTVGLHVTSLLDDASFYYIPACAAINDGLRRRLEGAELVFFDGTLFRDDEMITAGVGRKTGARMGHLSIGGEGGSLAAFSSMAVARKIYIHINNTNPVLLDRSEERRIVENAGWEVAYDSQLIKL